MTEYDCIVVGDVLRDIRKDNNLTQRDMAEKLNISQIHYSKIEQGERKLQIDMMIKIIDAFDVDANLFFGKSGCKIDQELTDMVENLKKLDNSSKRYILGAWNSILNGYMAIGC